MSLIRGLASRFGVSSPLPTNGDATKAQKEPQVVQQQADRVGLLVTVELEKAIARCKAKVEDIADECRSRNRKFRDLEFDLDNDQERCLHGMSTAENEKFRPADVLRVSQIFEDPQFIIDGTLSSDIEQGRLGDCWFLCAVATLSTMPGLIDKICVARDEKIGIYGFIFFRDGEWTDVIIDDQLYTTVPKYETLSGDTQNLYHNDKDLYNKVARKGRKTLYFACSSQENETWVPLLEKAYAKFHGDYASLNGGEAFEALEDLTGGVSQVIYTGDILDKDEFWNNDLLRAGEDRLFGCYLDSLSGKDVERTDTSTNGLFRKHAYSILNAAEYKGKRFLKVRNPWGNSEWTGRWSDGSKEWTKEWLGALEVLDHTFGDDGAFIMEYEDFLETWHAVERTQLFDSSWVQSSHWLNVTSRTFPSAWQYGDVSFTFSLSEASPATILLSQLDTRFWNDISGYARWSFDFVLYKKGSERILGRSEFTIRWPRSVTLTKELEAGDYVLHVRLDRNYIRQKNYVMESISKWDVRKFSRVVSEGARSMSIAANFNAKEWTAHLVVPPETFAGRDLTELEAESFDAAGREKKALRERFHPLPPQVTTVVFPDPEKEAVGVVPPDPNGNTAEGSAPTEPQKEQIAESASEKEPADVLKSDVPAQDPVNEPQAKDDVATDEKSSSDQPRAGEEPSSTEGVTVPDPIGPIHPGFSCDGCQGPIIGVRWRCLICDDYDLCDKCHGSGIQSLQHSVKHLMQRIENPDETKAVHNIVCDGCKILPVPGIRWKCLVCDDYDLCDACHHSGAHPVDHKMLRIVTPEDAEVLREQKNEGDDDDIVLGLRVYTKKDVPVNISGQLRHGKLVTWKKQI